MKKSKFKVGDYVVVTTKVFDRDENDPDDVWTKNQSGLSGYITEIEKDSNALPIWVEYDERSRLLYNEPSNTYNYDHLDYHPVTHTKLYKALK